MYNRCINYEKHLVLSYDTKHRKEDISAKEKPEYFLIEHSHIAKHFHFALSIIRLNAYSARAQNMCSAHIFKLLVMYVARNM